MTTIPSTQAQPSNIASTAETSSHDAKRADYITREGLLALLTDDEVARVSTMESSPRLANQEEYIDLLQLAEGVRRVQPSTVLTMGHVLPRTSVSAATWTKICARLTTSSK